MKFDDIPQFTRSGNWECDFPYDYFVREINRMVKEEGLQLNPDFQRGHVWTEEQQVKYIEFILKGGNTAKTVYFNHPSWESGGIAKKGEFVCVDGLQRITAIKQFIYNQIKVFGCYFDEYEDKKVFGRQLLGLKINVNSLQTKREVLQWYLEMNIMGTPHSEKEIDKVKSMINELKKEN